jgi:hypothetical protein
MGMKTDDKVAGFLINCFTARNPPKPPLEGQD